VRYLDAWSVPGETAYLVPIGDIHIGDKAFSKAGREKLLGYLAWIRDHDTIAKTFLLGDVFNVAGRHSKTSPFESNAGEYQEAINIFSPYKDLILGVIDGNHEQRIRNDYGFSPLESFARELGIPYCGDSALLRLRVGQRPKPEEEKFWQQYFCFIHHTTGGGGSLGNALNTIIKLDNLVIGCDVYLGGHNHQLVHGSRQTFRATAHGPKPHRMTYVSCGSYLEWEDSYAEMKALAPGKLGSPKVRFDGRRDRHDVHVSI